ncbi:MAG TPA: maltose acetyltransferase domain-containing protein [Rhodanobacteraceae bacterium]|nr:maltose acetyltransferase domain-containing protein [Rhodanobacteraceae bacterium]
MASERDKMLAGELYDAFDSELVARRAHACELCKAINASGEAGEGLRRDILSRLYLPPEIRAGDSRIER